jgi:hypothetical protein
VLQQQQQYILCDTLGRTGTAARTITATAVKATAVKATADNQESNSNKNRNNSSCDSNRDFVNKLQTKEQ